MRRYGVNFEMCVNPSGGLVAVGLIDVAALAAANRINEEHDIGSDLVICGRFPEDQGPDQLYLIGGGDPIKVARDFLVGSQAESYDPGANSELCRMLEAIYRIAPFKPVLANTAAYEARFTSRIDPRLAELVLRAMEDHGCQGMDYYASKLPDLSDEDIIASLVTDQRLHLWWD